MTSKTDWREPKHPAWKSFLANCKRRSKDAVRDRWKSYKHGWAKRPIHGK